MIKIRNVIILNNHSTFFTSIKEQNSIKNFIVTIFHLNQLITNKCLNINIFRIYSNNKNENRSTNFHENLKKDISQRKNIRQNIDLIDLSV